MMFSIHALNRPSFTPPPGHRRRCTGRNALVPAAQPLQQCSDADDAPEPQPAPPTDADTTPPIAGRFELIGAEEIVIEGVTFLVLLFL